MVKNPSKGPGVNGDNNSGNYWYGSYISILTADTPVDKLRDQLLHTLRNKEDKSQAVFGVSVWSGYRYNFPIPKGKTSRLKRTEPIDITFDKRQKTVTFSSGEIFKLHQRNVPVDKDFHIGVSLWCAGQ